MYLFKLFNRYIKRSNLHGREIGTILTATGICTAAVSNANNDEILATLQGAGRFLRYNLQIALQK